jgi:hypothetical protein
VTGEVVWRGTAVVREGRRPWRFTAAGTGAPGWPAQPENWASSHPIRTRSRPAIPPATTETTNAIARVQDTDFVAH